DRSLQPGEGGRACGGAGTEPRRLSDHIGQRPITNSIDVFWKAGANARRLFSAAPKAPHTATTPRAGFFHPRAARSWARNFPSRHFVGARGAGAPPAFGERRHCSLARRSWRARGNSRRSIQARLEPVINTPERNS